MNDKIIIKGAKEHNLKNINLEIPRDKLIVITGLSGSRKVKFSFRYIIRRRPKKICRKFIILCQTIFGFNGKARC